MRCTHAGLIHESAMQISRRIDLEFWARLPRMMQSRREFSLPRRIGNPIPTWNK